MKTVKLHCDAASFRGNCPEQVRWLEWETDFELVRRFSPAGIPEMTRQVWDEARETGFRYCAIIEDGRIVAQAAEFRFSDQAWMLAAVRTDESRRRQGFGRLVSLFITSKIVSSGRLATCETVTDNLPMIKTAMSIGYIMQPTLL